jgi:hypothetical protein
MNYRLKDTPDQLHTQTLPGLAQVAARGRCFAWAHSPGVFEHLADRQMGEHTHRQHHPKHHPVRQPASPLLGPARVQQGLLHNPRGDNLAQSRQPIQYAARILRRPPTASLRRHGHSLPEILALRQRKISDGYDLRLDERYWE